MSGWKEKFMLFMFMEYILVLKVVVGWMWFWIDRVRELLVEMLMMVLFVCLMCGRNGVKLFGLMDGVFVLLLWVCRCRIEVFVLVVLIVCCVMLL